MKCRLRSHTRILAAVVAGLVLQACVLASEKPLVDPASALRLLPDRFVATEEPRPGTADGLPRVAPVYDGQYADGKYALVRREDQAKLDVTFADLGGGDLVVMMEWHSDEETPVMYLTARYQAPYLIIDDPAYLADNIDDYRRTVGGDIVLIRDGSKFNDSLKIDSLESVRRAIGFYRPHNDSTGALIRYRIEPKP